LRRPWLWKRNHVQIVEENLNSLISSLRMKIILFTWLIQILWEISKANTPAIPKRVLSFESIVNQILNLYWIQRVNSNSEFVNMNFAKFHELCALPLKAAKFFRLILSLVILRFVIYGFNRVLSESPKFCRTKNIVRPD